MFKIAILISGNGSNMESIINNIKNKYLNCSVEMVISDNKEAYGLKIAKKEGIKTFIVDRKKYKGELSKEVLNIVNEKVDLIVLAGFLSILNGAILEKFNGRIINIHPSLIPSFCGKGMYGMNVHKKVIEYGAKVSGCTVHFVDKGTDTGPILIQKTVPVLEGDTPEILKKRVVEEEHKILPKAIKLISEGRVKIKQRKTIIR